MAETTKAQKTINADMTLTERERDLLALYYNGAFYSDIAEALDVPTACVPLLIKEICAKCGVQWLDNAAKRLSEAGLLVPMIYREIDEFPL